LTGTSGAIFQEFLTVTARQIGDRPHGSFFPKQFVREGRNITHVNPAATTVPPLPTARRAVGTSAPTGGKEDGRVQLFRRLFVGTTRPHRPEASGKIPGPLLSPGFVKA